MKYTFLIINKNGEDTLKRCVNAINKYKPDNSEVILVDDNSKDSSIEITKHLVDKVIRNERSIGIGRSRNKGIKKSKGDFIFIIDSDIEIKKLNIKEIESQFEDPKLAAISGFYISENTSRDWNTALDVRRKYIFGKDKKMKLASLRDYTTFSGGFSVLRSSSIQGMKFRKENGYSGEDLIFQIQLLNNGIHTLYLPSFFGIHHHKRSSRNIFKKVVSEANGAYWMVSECGDLGLKIPYYEYAINFPIFLILALIVPSNLLKVIFLLIEFAPYLIIAARQKFSLASIKLLFLALLIYLVRIPLIFLWVFKKGISIKSKLSLLSFSLFSDLSAKTRYIRYNFI